MGGTSPTVHYPAREERFGYICRRCLNCCHNKSIQLNPYEVARLARNRGVSTTVFRSRWTVDGKGTELARTESGACELLGSEGCTVHADRPLVCRLYPLGRHVTPGGNESFSHVPPHPRSGGEYSREGTIRQYLLEQGVEPFMRAADDYYFWLCRAQDALGQPSHPGAATAEVAAAELLDMDHAIAVHCAASRRAEPGDLEERRLMHLEILDRLVAESAQGEENDDTE